MKNDEKSLTLIGERFGAQIAALISRGWVFTATVEDVSDGYAYVSRYDGDTPIKVALDLLGSASATIRLTPAIGSLVAVANSDGNVGTPFVVGFEQIAEVSLVRGSSEVKLTFDDKDENNDQAYLRIGESTIDVTKDAIKLNGGNLGGLVEVGKLTQRLNDIENDINALKSAFASWVVVPSDGGAALLALTKSWSLQTLSLSKNSDYENSKIIQ